MTDYLAEAKTCAGSIDTKLATMYALVSIAESLKRLADRLAPGHGNCDCDACRMEE